MKKDDSFDGFYKKYKDRLFSYLVRLTGDPTRSLDFTQESFTRYFSRYQKREKSRALLYTIARNTALDAFRKRKDEEITWEKAGPLEQSPEHRLIEKQRIQEIQDAIECLDPLDRELIRLVSSERLTYREIGKRLDLSESNVKVRVHRARIRIRDILKNGEV